MNTVSAFFEKYEPSGTHVAHNHASTHLIYTSLIILFTYPPKWSDRSSFQRSSHLCPIHPISFFYWLKFHAHAQKLYYTCANLRKLRNPSYTSVHQYTIDVVKCQLTHGMATLYSLLLLIYNISANILITLTNEFTPNWHLCKPLYWVWETIRTARSAV